MKLNKIVLALSSFAPVLAFAAVPTEVTAAITGGGADGMAIVTAMAIGGAAVFILKKLLSRFGLSL